MPPVSPSSPNLSPESRQILARYFKGKWYLSKYPDVAAMGFDPWFHFISYGLFEGRDPNSWFDSAWYLGQNPDVAARGVPPILDYIDRGAANLRSPHPTFDASWYAKVHPEGATNPLLHHLLFGEALNWPTRPPAEEAQASAPSDDPQLDYHASLIHKTRQALPQHISVVVGLFDPEWYHSRYPDTVGENPLEHFLNFGIAEMRDPNRWFDSAWYTVKHPEAVLQGLPPLIHYLTIGIAQRLNPHPRFNVSWYVQQHPEAASNPLLYHKQHGEAHRWMTEPQIDIAEYLPSGRISLACPETITVDVIIPVYRGVVETQRCLESVLADRERPRGKVIVVDDCSPEPTLARWLAGLRKEGRITLIRNRRNLGFVASVNAGIAGAGANDVVLLNSDTEVPRGWLRRLAAHAYETARIASVSPFSNNATICGYPSNEGGPMPLGLDVETVDSACREANEGRSISVPTSVGFCMYIRRKALDEVGGLDADSFGHGYGEENDFCMRATERGWIHRLACDIFVYHKGSVSFGSDGSNRARKAQDILRQRYPDYELKIAEHVGADAVAPYRFAITAALYRHMGLPVILLLSHELGGGVERHINTLVGSLAGVANVLLLQSSSRDTTLSMASLERGPSLTLPPGRTTELIELVRSAGATRAHIHHLMGFDFDVRTFIHRLSIPFEFTVHDYFAICPQVNLLARPFEHYCGEPGPASCNACIAGKPTNGATDILLWRAQYEWLYRDADRVICPSNDALTRLRRYGLSERAIVVPHEPVGTVSKQPTVLKKGDKLRIAILGVLAPQKGAQSVAEVIEMADPETTEFHLIGYLESRLHYKTENHLVISGQYAEGELSGLINRVKPHVAWFPAQWPETYSYTLSAAIDAGLPIVASRIGAFVERLEGRSLSWLVDPRASAARWLHIFDLVRHTLMNKRRPAASAQVSQDFEFYKNGYLMPPTEARAVGRLDADKTTTNLTVDLKRPGRISIVIVPERLSNGLPSPCAFIRLLLPLEHLAASANLHLTIVDPTEVLQYNADVFVTQRCAIPDIDTANNLVAHCRRYGAALVFDLDDDLLHVPHKHPDAPALRPKAKLVEHLVCSATTVFVSTRKLAETLVPLRQDVMVIPNGLDERLWMGPLSGVRPRWKAPGAPVRLLYMGTATHKDDFALIESSLVRVKEAFKEHVELDVIGIDVRSDQLSWIRHPTLSPAATVSYPGFVNWIAQQAKWDIGLAPLADTPFNRCKSWIKTLDYGALGLAIAASDVTPYRDSIADGEGGLLIPNRPENWYVALSRLIRDAELRSKLSQCAFEQFVQGGTLLSKQDALLTAWQSVTTRNG
jgi:GT2 family glycosyltransferase/glycosyltransferase involved in cell wall biosynthesis